MTEAPSKKTPDGVQMAMISSRMETIARKMQNTIFRTARSGILNTAHDFSCVVLTADCQMLAAAESLPNHTLIGPDLMCQAVLKHHPVMKRGDCFLHNSPYEGNSHAADHCMIVPVVDDDGVLRFFVLAKAHQADCGNSRPSTYLADVKDLYEEGALIFSATKIQENYETNQDIVRMCQARIRVPDQWWGDFLATLGSVRIGERELLSLGRELGWDALEGYAERWFDYSEQKMIGAISKLTSGKITLKSAHDPFLGLPDGIPVKVDVEIDAVNATIVVDLRDNPDCQPCGLNLTEATSKSAAMIGIFNALLDHSVIPNSGSFRRIDVKLRENCCVGIPRHPASCSVATTNLADHVTNPVQRAIAELSAGFGQAATGPIQPPGMGVISGRDPHNNNEPFINQVHIGVSGGAGTPVTDGFLSIIHAGNAGMCRIDSVEVDELHHPILIEDRHIMEDSEGAGTYRGAPSIYSEYGPWGGGELTVLYAADGTITPAAGTRGGGAGSTARAAMRKGDGSVVELPPCHGITLAAGEKIISHSASGGGYGLPTERDPSKVIHDLAEGWISLERARDVYGVVVSGSREADNLALDAAATEAVRRGSGGLKMIA
ncbi:hydantoinase B/oxoprolinase family protein [Rhizobium laguerreae]|uniref:Hydantoinase B/oxoprolinase family protein n=1 Tax=Rhizobium laguerreae TaxID=1076926 RepID=A0A1S9GBP3_9HYPH|nr:MULTISPECIES: hydantoinase B/oxoprolinase family protein [Rhizobium]MBB3165684.1 N-methylhydantoinase B [Rhizobium laguerreae]MBY3066900.1 hydantoinase B/oxoprolinase family protein [Rhizobium laguerreae]MBY3079553.1 hydantoinase B/oxoprolinase family protein [Rhizobium laguerreae]MBY3094887.1 hydantoinase B/oxoprolinase family protein [Rhizobium laguerreae]MBY3113159.1 hydantoinase B/oxoprolinase family protein [Rhizobium laguerreae]